MKRYKSLLRSVFVVSVGFLLLYSMVGCGGKEASQQEQQNSKNTTTPVSQNFEQKTTQPPTESISKEKNINNGVENNIKTQAADSQFKDAEKFIIQQLNSKNDSKETRTKIFSVLPSFDWKKYSEIQKDTDLIGWISKQKDLKESEIVSIVAGMKNIDGAYAEGYGDILSKIFAESPTRLVKALDGFQLSKTDDVCKTMFLGVEAFAQTTKNSIKDELTKMNTTSTTSSKEKEIIAKLIELLSKKL